MRRTAYGALLVIALRAAEGTASAAQPAEDVRVPVIAVEAGREVLPDEVEAVVRGIEAPVIRGRDLLGRLGVVAVPPGDLAESLSRIFASGEDKFFAGNLREAAYDFKTVIEKTRVNPEILAVVPRLRDIVFKSHIHLAVMSRGEDEGEAVQDHLFNAASEFPDLEPAPTEFPPWVRERYALVRSSGRQPDGAIVVDAPPDCEISLSGRVLGTGGRFEGIERGEYHAIARCPDRKSMLERIRVGDEEIRFRPIFLSYVGFNNGNKDIKLVKKEDAAISGVVDDTVSLTRACGQERLVAVVGLPGGLEVWLIDVEAGGVIRKASAPPGDREGAEMAGRALVTESDVLSLRDAHPETRPWYNDWLAWTLVGAGAAALGTGLVFTQVFGTPSKEEPLTWALMFTGGGLMATGTVLFFFPVRSHENSASATGGLSLGLMTSGTF